MGKLRRELGRESVETVAPVTAGLVVKIQIAGE